MKINVLCFGLFSWIQALKDEQRLFLIEAGQ